MDYFSNVLAVFLGLKIKIKIKIKNNLLCVPKMNEGLIGLKQHEGE